MRTFAKGFAVLSMLAFFTGSAAASTSSKTSSTTKKKSARSHSVCDDGSKPHKASPSEKASVKRSRRPMTDEQKAKMKAGRDAARERRLHQQDEDRQQLDEQQGLKPGGKPVSYTIV